ncbi:MAG: substrate-binding domain-containing protein [Deltaproteobacteria bacterium]|nr:substrate-binding domain-containing protein [Deltaproteobacteria bacterium]
MRKYKNRLLDFTWIVVLLIAPVLVVGCGDDDKEEAKEYKIAWISKGVDNSVFKAGYQGALLKAKELTDAGPDKVTLIYDTARPKDATVEEQLPVLEAAVNLPVDGIGISATNVTALDATINAAVAKGIKVMTWDSDAPASDRFTYLGVSNTEGGTLAARALAKKVITDTPTRTAGNFVILSGESGAANLNDRINGFKAGLAAANTALGTTFNADTVYYVTGESGALQAQMMELILGSTDVDPVNDAEGTAVTTIDNLAGIFLVGAWALFDEELSASLPLWKAAGTKPVAERVYTAAFDTLPIQLDYMEAGQLHVLIGQKYWGWGYDTIQMIYNVLKGTKTYEKAWTDSGIDVICTEAGRSLMATMWDSYDFTQALPDCDLVAE